MTSSEPPSAKPGYSNQAWRLDLEGEIEYDKANGEKSQLPSVFIQLLTSYSQDHQIAAQKAADQVHADYRDVFLPSDPLVKHDDDKGMTGFLGRFYELLFSQGKLIEYDNTGQDALVQVLVALRKLPPISVNIWGEGCLAFINDPVFAVTGEDRWNGNYPNELREDWDGPTKDTFAKKCNRWVNLSAFLARCTEAGLYDHYDDCFKYPSIDIPLGLKEELQSNVLSDCRIMAASQWIIHAGHAIRKDVIKTSVDGWNLAAWKAWATRLRMISQTRSPQDDLAHVTQQAFEKMTSIDAEAANLADG